MHKINPSPTNGMVTLKMGLETYQNIFGQNDIYLPESFSWQGHFSSIKHIKLNQKQRVLLEYFS